MKVIAINGSPRENGNTAYALQTAGRTLQQEGIDFEIIHVGDKPIRGCIACGQCVAKQNGQCAIKTDLVNETLAQMHEADGIIIGSPVYYSGIAGTMKCFLDRTFYVASANGRWFRHKVGAAVTAVRRTGGSMTFSAMNQYLTLSEMLIPTSNYWNVIHGRTLGEAAKDDEGMQVMRVLGRNMAWLLHMRRQGLDEEPEKEAKVMTNFIR